MSSHVEASGSAIAHEVEADGTRRSLLAVLLLTTAWAGAAGVVVVPTAFVVVGAVVVAGATCVAGLLVPYLLPWDVGTQMSVVGAATAVSTLVVIAVHRRRERRRGQQERGTAPAGSRT